MGAIRIPKTIDDAVGRLTGLGALLTASEWERAAIVAAFVEVSDSRAHRAHDTSGMSPTEFAALGIEGLRSPVTVRRYAKAWSAATYTTPKPGTRVKLPSTPWPSEERNTGTRITETSIAAAIEERPEVARAARQALEALDEGRMSDRLPPRPITPTELVDAGERIEAHKNASQAVANVSDAVTALDRALRVLDVVEREQYRYHVTQQVERLAFVATLFDGVTDATLAALLDSEGER